MARAVEPAGLEEPHRQLHHVGTCHSCDDETSRQQRQHRGGSRVARHRLRGAPEKPESGEGRDPEQDHGREDDEPRTRRIEAIEDEVIEIREEPDISSER